MTRATRLFLVLFLCGLCGIASTLAQVTSVGAGGYTTTLPAGAVGPQATIYATTPAPIATHKFWTSKLWTPLSGGNNMYPEPLGANAGATGMQLGYLGDVYGWDPTDNNSDKSGNTTAFYQGFEGELTLGNASLNAANVKIAATSDWTADFAFAPSLTVRLGRGMPFAYALTDGTPVTVTFANAPTVVQGTIGTDTMIAVSDTYGAYGVSYTNYWGLFCPTGGAWAQSGNTLTCTTPSGKNYMSIALLPGLSSAVNTNTTTIAQQMTDFSKVAFSFPANTAVSWAYNQSSSTVTTTYTVTPQSMDRSSTDFLMALNPHQYDALPGGVNTTYSYLTDHGSMKVNIGAAVTTTDTFHGVLPFMPPTTNYDLTKLKIYVDEAPAASLQGDTYAQGKNLGQTAQLLPLAQLADASAYTTLDASLQSVMQNWFTATPSKTADLFYYNQNWGSMIGFPAGYDTNDQLNDHHFHYGYYIHAAALNGLFNPSWIASSQWGGMVGLLQQDIANYDRTNTMFPFLRHFDVYAGHSWAAGTAPFGDGENEESSSEAVNAWTGMILLGAATGNTQMRDAGIWLYTQETKGVSYYWFNEQPAWVNSSATSTFPSWFTPVRVANVFDDKGDTGTWFGANPDYEHAIEYLPFTGGSLHLGLNPAYVAKNYAEDYAENGNSLPDWPDLMEMYQALSDPASALTEWQANNPANFPQQGETLAHEYAWLMSLNALGQVDASVTANTPFYAVFNNGGTKSHVAFNPTSAVLDVTFSDGATVTVPAGSMASDSALVTPITVGAGIVTAQPPAAPVGLVATAKSSTEIDVSWASTSNVTWNLFRSETSGFTPDPSNQIATGLSVASYADASLTAATTYYYAVEAVNGAGSSGPSSEVSAQTSAASGGGGTVAESNSMYFVGGATGTTPSLLSFTAGIPGVDSAPANNPQSVGTPANPLVYVITGINGTYDSALSTAFNLYVDAGANAGEGAQAEVIYDLLGDGTQIHTETYSLFATDPVVSWEDYTATSRGGLNASTGALGNMVNGTVTVKVWDALPGPNVQPMLLSVGNTTSALSDLVIPFDSVTQTLSEPVTPTGLTATAANSSQINLSWTASTTVGVSYSLYRSTTSGFTPSAANLVIASLGATSYADVNLNAATTYYYVVEAVNGLGNSAPSTQASATTLAFGGPTPESSNMLYFVAGANATTPSKLTFTAGPSGVDDAPANNPQSVGTPANPLVYTVTGINGTYDSTQTTGFNLYVDAGANVGEGSQAEVVYDLLGDGTQIRTETYSMFATNPVVDWEDYTATSRGGLSASTGALGNMVNGTVTIKVWDALPGPNAQPMMLSVGGNPSALSDLSIPFTGITEGPAGPAAPTSVVAQAVASTQVNLSWTASTTNGATYNVYRSTTAGFTPATANLLTNTSATTYVDSGVVASTTYYYVVGAVNSGGLADAPAVSVTTPAPPLVNTTTTLTVSAAQIIVGASETFTATVAPSAATGSVTFKNGSTTLGTGTVTAGVATYTTTTLAAGNYNLTAIYSGDSGYATSTSAAQSVAVEAGPPAIALSLPIPDSATIIAGGSASFAVNLAAKNGFNGTVSLSCSGLPVLATCSFSPQTVAVSGSKAGTSTLIITTTGTTSALNQGTKPGSSALPLFAACVPFGLAAGFLFGGKRRRKFLGHLMLALGLVAMFSVVSACGGSTIKAQTPPGGSTITITATSGSVTSSTSLSIEVL